MATVPVGAVAIALTPDDLRAYRVCALTTHDHAGGLPLQVGYEGRED